MFDLRTYKLVPGGQEEFDRIFREGALPMLRGYGIKVIAYGASLADDGHYYLLRAFASATVREEELAAF